MLSQKKICPQCAEKIKIAALVCRHCGHKFDATEVAAERRKQSLEAGGGCAVMIALVLLLAYCVSPTTPKGGDWFAAGTRSAITESVVTGDHLNIEAIVGDPQELGRLPASIAAMLRQVRAALAKDEPSGAAKTRTITIGFWFASNADHGRDREPLVVFDGRTEAFLTVAPDASDAELLAGFDSVEARPPLGDLVIRDACAQADEDFRKSALCLDSND